MSRSIVRFNKGKHIGFLWVQHGTDDVLLAFFEYFPGLGKVTQRQVVGDEGTDVHQSALHEDIGAPGNAAWVGYGAVKIEVAAHDRAQIDL
jgi:hypothetical protein